MMTLFNRRHLANIITFTRIFGVVTIFWLTPFANTVTQLWTIVIYTLVSATDFVDGWVARRLKIVSDLGKVLDPLADKILILVFLPLLEMQVISAFPVFIILAREFAIMAVRVVSAKDGSVIGASVPAKVKTAVSLPVCGILLGRFQADILGDIPSYLEPLYYVMLWVQSWPSWIIFSLIWLTVAITIWSFLEYFGAFIWQRYINQSGDEATAKLRLRAVVPNSVSMLNLTIGLFAISLAYQGQISMSVLLVLISIFLDALDGRLARILNAQSHFGATLDSKADLVSFGVSPGVIGFYIVSSSPLPGSTILGVAVGAIYFFSVYYRLRRFNDNGHSDTFEGLPSPVGASIVALFALIQGLNTWIYIFIVLLSCGLMVSMFPYKHNTSGQKTFLKFLFLPTFVGFCLCVLSLLPFNLGVLTEYRMLYIYGLLISISIYVISPLRLK